MKLKVSEIPEEGLTLFLQEKESRLESLLRRRELEFRFASPLLVRLNVAKSKVNIIFIKGEIISSLVMICARCLGDFKSPLNLNLKYTLLPLREKEGYAEEVALTREDLEFVFYKGEEIDLLEIILEEIILSIPNKPICQEGCRGLCPYCGVNLNIDKCQCKDNQLDFRLALLKDFKLKN